MSDIDEDTARRLIRELSPLAASDVELLGAGTDSAAFRVDDEWVVRFPLAPDAQRALRTELALLPWLAEDLPVDVPMPAHIAERDGRLVFSAYRALEGQPLSDGTLGALSPPARARALDDLAALLEAIHRFPVERARAAGVSFELFKGAYHTAQAVLERELPGVLGSDELTAIARQRAAFDRVLGSEAPVLLHADIKPAHLLHDQASGALTGLLDWGDVSLGHAYFDLAIVGAFCGARTLAGLLERMNESEAERARATIPFLLTIRWLQDASYIGERRQQAEPAIRRLREHLVAVQ
jgi:aminoglycoside 2''-phosphotransferase